MKSKTKKTKVLFLLTLLTIFLFSGIFNGRFSKNIITNNNSLEFNEKNQIQIKQSGFWDLTENPIYIDDLATGVGAHNWTWAETQPWCSGSGSWAYPYVIENVTIDGQSSGSCIEIKNSDAYFIVRNCSLYNSSSSSFDAGIKLDNVDNGKIINNNCSDNNSCGLYLGNSDNNTLSGNTANNNTYGILLWYSNNNTLSENNASNNNNYGIVLFNSINNALSGNNASNNNIIGIYLTYSNNNTLSENNANNNNYEGIYLNESNNNTLSGNTANNNNRIGIYLWYSNNNTLSENNASNNSDHGIYLNESNNNTISGNTVNNNTVGICLQYSINNTLSGNLMNFCGIHLYGSLVEVASHSIDDTNLVNNKPVYYYANEIALESSNFTYAGQIILINCNNSKISGINISDGSGIYLYYCVNNTISRNNASNNNFLGIYLDNSDNNTISGNTASNNLYGICLWYSNNNTISGNNASNNNDRGIYLNESNNNTISGNNANNNNDFGIFLQYSNNNTISGNTISYNSNGTRLDSNSNNNKIFLNHFINNEINAEDNGINNTWDNGTIGNYWSDYAGVDANHDGIGDTPYLIPGTAGSRDNFPIYDNIPPVIIIIFPLPDGVFGLDAPNYQITINELNLDIIWYTLDGGGTNYTITSLTGIFTQTAWSALSEGSVTIRFYAKDSAGNVGSAAVTVEKDISAPVITLFLPLAESIFGLDAPNYNISIDEFNLDTIWYTLDGGGTNYTITGLTGTFNQLAWGALSEGSVIIRFYANDSAGNAGSAAVSVKKDISAPVITIIFPLPDSVFGLIAPNYNISIDELNLDTIWYTLDGGIKNYTITSLIGTFNQTAWEVLTEGTFTIRFYANDTAGNTDFIDVEVIIEIPENLPIISFGNYYILFMFITILSFIILEKRKKK
jgi:parallel beta-helix repeat protein